MAPVASIDCYPYHYCVSIHDGSENCCDQGRVGALAFSTEDLNRQRLSFLNHRMAAGSRRLCAKLWSHRYGGCQHIVAPLFPAPLVRSWRVFTDWSLPHCELIDSLPAHARDYQLDSIKRYIDISSITLKLHSKFCNRWHFGG